jgi:hypothetical protein
MIEFDVNTPAITSARRKSGCWPFISSFRDFLQWIRTAFTAFHTLCYRKKIQMVLWKGINEFQMLCGRFKLVEIIPALHCCPWPIVYNGV